MSTPVGVIVQFSLVCLNLLPNLLNYVLSLGNNNIPNAGGSAAQIDQFEYVGVCLEYDLILVFPVFVNLLRQYIVRLISSCSSLLCFGETDKFVKACIRTGSGNAGESGLGNHIF